MATSVLRLELTADEAVETRKLLDEISEDPRMTDQYYFLERSHVLSHELPRRVRETFYRFKRREEGGVLHVAGSPVLRDGAGATPTSYVETEPGFAINDAQVLHGLYGALLGEPIGFTSQRAGSIYNTIAPMPHLAEISNSSSGSKFDFGFHVEDAFHPARPDFLGLACMRNDEQAGTTVSCVDGIDNLKPEERDALFAPRFNIGHNPIHETSGTVEENWQPIFFGRRERPYVRVNFAALDLADYSGVERGALQRLKEYLEENKATLVLQAGEFVYVDNFRCVHARDAYEPLPAGKSRWLSRVVFTSDLRKSAGLRSETMSRSIYA
ncbi:TauD/TfdA family dioxygenase [Streptomyces sp. H39-C1]|uniref:TauD/TfdA family dioxygenase n=1 Tax=Streptomyces sp. H39-C1 TaxID=3004355 RepID=UPI0022AF184D|nr:TauD/TfdA family dioxygenase [Streptomyces sp. H39-C1]MCZ4099174.1 TauD/TfdA family dioxygenase [Streptomyces sp. H39-C1]